MPALEFTKMENGIYNFSNNKGQSLSALQTPKEMKAIIIEDADSTAQERGYKYNVQLLIDGYYCGNGKFCKDVKEVNEYIEKQLTEKERKKDLLGVYALKSPYHDREYYLPYIIVSYRQSDKTYEIMTVEYKGMTAYQVEQNCSESSILELITNGTIIKKANPDNFKDSKEIRELVSQFSNAENQQL